MEYRYEATKTTHVDDGEWAGQEMTPFVYITSDPAEIAEIELALFGNPDDVSDEPDRYWSKTVDGVLIEIEAP